MTLVLSRFPLLASRVSSKSYPPLLRRCVGAARVVILPTLLLSTCHAQSSRKPPSYADYPQKRGELQPLQWPQLPSWLTLNMELRDRVEGNTSYGYKQDGNRVYDLTRVWGGLEIRPTRHITGFLQFIDTHALGLPNTAQLPNMRDQFDARQALFNLHGRAGRVPLQAIVGRQELKFGSERVIGVSDFANNSRTFDGFDLRVGDQNRIDLFSASEVITRPTSLDKHGPGLTFHGAYANLSSVIPQGHLQPYVLVRTVRHITDKQGRTGDKIETTFGVEANGKLPAQFDYLINASLQRGSYGQDAIHAGQSFGRLNYTLPRLPWQPRFGVEYDYATGSPRRNSFRVSTYDQQFPSNHNAFGQIDLFGYQNLRQERFHIDLGPTPNLTFLIQGQFLHVASVMDNVYAPPATIAVAAPTGGFASREIGQGLDVGAKYVFRSNTVFNAGLTHLFPGALLRQSNRGAAQTYAFFSLTYRFRVDKHATPSASLNPTIRP